MSIKRYLNGVTKYLDIPEDETWILMCILIIKISLSPSFKITFSIQEHKDIFAVFFFFLKHGMGLFSFTGSIWTNDNFPTRTDCCTFDLTTLMIEMRLDLDGLIFILAHVTLPLSCHSKHLFHAVAKLVPLTSDVLQPLNSPPDCDPPCIP